MLFAYINLAIVFHCLIFGIFFLIRTKEGIGRANFPLGLFLIFLSVISLSFALKSTGWIYDFPYLIDLDWAVGFWLAPLYLWYVREMTGEKLMYNWKQYALLIPGLLVLCYYAKFHFKSSEEQLAYIDLIQSVYIQDYQISDWLFYPYIQTFFIYVIVLLYRRKDKISGVFKDNCLWLLKYTIMLLAFGFFGAGIYLLPLPPSPLFVDILPLVSSVLYVMIIYRFLGQKWNSASFEDGGLKEHKPKYTNSSLDEEEALRLNEELCRIMEQNKLYLQPDLTLQTLAREINVKHHHLSQIINQQHRKNFSDFVNDYRVKEARKMIIENGHLKLEAIGYESGFNTKATFNTAFKKITGCTPSEFRKKRAGKDVKTYNI